MRRTGEPAVRAGLVAQWAVLAEIVGDLGDAALAGPTRLAGWRIRELVVHLTGTVDAVSRALGHPVPDRADPGATPTDDFRAAVAGATDVLREVPTDRSVTVELAAVSLTELLATRCVEATVHHLDLAAALDRSVGTGRLEPAAVRPAVRWLAAALAARAPGRAVELRIPPYAAVQCVAGPRHTRGTPANVVETDPVSWLELATGRLDWTAARRSGRLTASGARADLTAYLPILTCT